MDPAARCLDACLDPARPLTVERFGRTRVSTAWRLDRRRVPEHYLWCVLRGRGRAAAGGHSIDLAPGAVGWIAPQEPHDLVPDPAAGDFIFYHLRLALAAPAPTAALLLPRAGHLRPAFAAAHDEWTGRLPLRERRFRGLLAALLADLLRAAGPAEAHDPDPERRARLLRLVDERLPRPLHPAALLAAVGLSHDYGTRWFRRAFGQAPRTWLREQRIRRAADELAHGGETVAEVARRWGYADHRLFDRQFREVFGCTPGGWRRR